VTRPVFSYIEFVSAFRDIRRGQRYKEEDQAGSQPAGHRESFPSHVQAFRILFAGSLMASSMKVETLRDVLGADWSPGSIFFCISAAYKEVSSDQEKHPESLALPPLASARIVDPRVDHRLKLE